VESDPKRSTWPPSSRLNRAPPAPPPLHFRVHHPWPQISRPMAAHTALLGPPAGPSTPVDEALVVDGAAHGPLGARREPVWQLLCALRLSVMVASPSNLFTNTTSPPSMPRTTPSTRNCRSLPRSERHSSCCGAGRPPVKLVNHVPCALTSRRHLVSRAR